MRQRCMGLSSYCISGVSQHPHRKPLLITVNDSVEGFHDGNDILIPKIHKPMWVNQVIEMTTPSMLVEDLCNLPAYNRSARKVVSKMMNKTLTMMRMFQCFPWRPFADHSWYSWLCLQARACVCVSWRQCGMVPFESWRVVVSPSECFGFWPVSAPHGSTDHNQHNPAPTILEPNAGALKYINCAAGNAQVKLVHVPAPDSLDQYLSPSFFGPKHGAHHGSQQKSWSQTPRLLDRRICAHRPIVCLGIRTFRWARSVKGFRQRHIQRLRERDQYCGYLASWSCPVTPFGIPDDGVRWSEGRALSDCSCSGCKAQTKG